MLTLAVQFMPKAMREFCTREESPPLYYLVESNICPDHKDGFKIELQDGEPFGSDFIGASKEQCQIWAQENWREVNFIEQNVITIVDQRSARDGTLLLSFYFPEVDPKEPTLGFDQWGQLPANANTWYDFRIDHRGADEIYGALMWAGKRIVLNTSRGGYDVIIDRAWHDES